MLLLIQEQIDQRSDKTMTLAEAAKMNYKELMTYFSIGRNAAEALSNYLMTLGWGYGVKAATEAASDFIDCEEDLNQLEKALKRLTNA